MCARSTRELAGYPDSKKGPPKEPSAPWKRMRSSAPRAPSGQSAPLPSAKAGPGKPPPLAVLRASGNKGKKKSEVKISLEAGAKFQALFSLILPAWKLNFEVKASFPK